MGLWNYTFAQRRNRLTTHFSERIPVVKRRLSVYARLVQYKRWRILTLNTPSLARQRCLSSWGPRRTPWVFFFVISQLFDAVDYSNYVFWVSETIIQ